MPHQGQKKVSSTGYTTYLQDIFATSTPDSYPGPLEVTQQALHFLTFPNTPVLSIEASTLKSLSFISRLEMPVYCLEHVYPLLLTRELQRCFSMGPHRTIASSVCWAQLSRGWSALRGTRLFLHSICTVQKQEDTENGKRFILTRGQASKH